MGCSWPRGGGASVFEADAFGSSALEPDPAPAPAPAPAAPSIRAEQAGAGFDAVLEEIMAGFAADPTPSAPAPAGLLVENKGSIEAPTPEPDFDGIQEEIVAGFLADVVPDALASEAALVGAEPKPAPVEAPERVSLEETDDLAGSLADRLNREAEGIEAGPVTVAVAPKSEQWAEALRLTREAAFAWANLLNAPAVVSIER